MEKIHEMLWKSIIMLFTLIVDQGQHSWIIIGSSQEKYQLKQPNNQ